MDNDKIKEIFNEILEEHPLLAQTIADAYEEVGPVGLEILIKEHF